MFCFGFPKINGKISSAIILRTSNGPQAMRLEEMTFHLKNDDQI